MLKENVEVFKKPFLITGKAHDPSGIDYTQVCHSADENDEFGDVIVRKYYNTYDVGTETYSGLCVRILFNYTRDGNNEITHCVEVIEWYFTDDTLGLTRKNYRKF